MALAVLRPNPHALDRPVAASGFGVRREVIGITSVVDRESPVNCSLTGVTSLAPCEYFLIQDLHSGETPIGSPK